MNADPGADGERPAEMGLRARASRASGVSNSRSTSCRHVEVVTLRSCPSHEERSTRSRRRTMAGAVRRTRPHGVGAARYAGRTIASTSCAKAWNSR